ncbi:rRNA biogenesis protein rrp36 [Trapelia coarctata]|nr:rRNA biogenesis protein rrp36 [Trapelia coarctata]
MALTDILQRRIRASKEDLEEENLTPSSDSEQSVHSLRDGSDNGSNSSSENDGESAERDDQESDSDEEALNPSQLLSNALQTISFGALASAQASIGLKRKRPPSSTTYPSKQRSISLGFPEAQERLAGKKDHRVLTRTSKHAPAELSSKKAVSRKRSVVPTPTIEHRDPRFEALSGPLDTNKLNNNYAFLKDYRTSEIAALKANVRKTTDPVTKADLKKQLLSMESKEKARAAKEAEQEVIREHRKREKQAVEKGKKPFYLKKGEQKKLALVKRFEGMGEKKVEKVIERRRKKKAGRERRNMPDRRRVDGLEA